MITIDLKSIIDNCGIDYKEVAANLFPSNKHAKVALDRVIRGEAFLDTNQLSRLSALTGISIDNFFNNNNWKPVGSENKITFTQGNFKAVLDTVNWTTKIFHNNKMVHEEMIHSKSITLDEYTNELNKLILKLK